MEYLLPAGHSIIRSCSLLATKRVDSSFNVACSPLTNLFKGAEKVCCFSCSSRTAGRAAVEALAGFDVMPAGAQRSV